MIRWIECMDVSKIREVKVKGIYVCMYVCGCTYVLLLCLSMLCILYSSDEYLDDLDDDPPQPSTSQTKNSFNCPSIQKISLTWYSTYTFLSLSLNWKNSIVSLLTTYLLVLYLYSTTIATMYYVVVQQIA
jgi:hypothetical protein